jgi:hypothetical protein
MMRMPLDFRSPKDSKAAKDAKSEILKQAQDPTVLLKAAQVAGEAQKNIQNFGDKPVQE